MRYNLTKPHFKKNKKPHFDKTKQLVSWDKLPVMKCAISDGEIEDLRAAMVSANTGLIVDFDNALEDAKSNYKLRPNEHFVYIGNGKFAIIQYGHQNSFEIKQEIPYETSEEKTPFREKLKFKIKRFVDVEAKPIDQLYTKEEMLQFPKLGTDLLANLE